MCVCVCCMYVCIVYRNHMSIITYECLYDASNFPFRRNCRSRVIFDDVIYSVNVPSHFWAVCNLVILTVDRRTYSITSVTDKLTRLNGN